MNQKCYLKQLKTEWCSLYIEFFTMSFSPNFYVQKRSEFWRAVNQKLFKAFKIALD